MAYSTSNPPVLVTQGIVGSRHWVYSSADTDALVQVSGYFSNGWDLGMRAGDTVMVIDNDASPIAVVHHVVVSATSAAVDLDDGVPVSGADSD